MNKLLTTFLCFATPVAGWAQSNTTLCINEIMQSNLETLLLENDFPDSWVELHNPTSAAIDLYNYYIGLDANVASAYRITEHATVPAKGYLVIPCDKVGTGIHTDFRLESTSAGAIYLFDASKALIDMLEHPAMPAPEIAYGRISAEEGWGWEINPTPGKANDGVTATTLLPEPVFSLAGRVMKEAQQVTVTMPEGNFPADTKLYVTTDGTEPTLASTAYEQSFTMNVDKSTVIRAKLISKSALCRPSTTQSYIFHPRDTRMPIVSIATDQKYLYSDAMGIFSNATTDGQANYMYEWRRPVNAEYLGSDGSHGFNQVGEIGVGGNATRHYAQKTIKLYANKRFGTKRLEGQFWAEKKNVTKVKSFYLRNGGNNCDEARINDALIQRLFGTHVSNLDYQAYTPAIVYINGEYNGVVGLRERSNDDFVEANYGIEDALIATQLSYLTGSSGNAERQRTNFTPFYNLYRSSSSTYKQLEAQMDVDNFMKTMIAEMSVPNTDYPHNNIAMWLTPEGKWRWILKDMDFFAINNSKSPVTFNMFYYMLDVSRAKEGTLEYKFGNKGGVKEAVKLYKKMISFPEFKEPFIDAFAVYLGDFLKPANFVATCDSMRQEIHEEALATFEHFNFYDPFDEWSDFLRDYCQKRPAIVYQQLAEFFYLGNLVPMTLSPKGSPVTINGVAITEGDFDGNWFTDRDLRLATGKDNVGWQMTVYHKVNGKMVQSGEAQTWANPEVSLRLGEIQDCDSVAFATYIFDANEFDKKLEELAIDNSLCQDWSMASTITLAEPAYAYANITGIEQLPASKYDDLHAYIDFYDNNGNYLRKKILLNLQGSSETKANLSISFCEDEWIGDDTPNITFGDWAAQDEFHLKAFYEDGLKGTAEVAYQLYGQITERENCYPKAFPLSLYVNGDYYGIMAWQLKKHRSNMGLDKKTSSNVWLDGTLNDKQLFQGAVNWTKFEVRNPKDLYNMDGTDYDGDNPQEIIDATSDAYTGKGKMVRCAEAKQYILDMSRYNLELAEMEGNGASTEEMRASIQSRFDVPELINYMVFSLVSNNYDGFSKNWQWFTYDGVKWTVAPYDCNLTFGYNEDGITLWPAEQSSKKYDYRMSNADLNGPMRWIRTYFWDDVKARYAALRDAKVIDTDNITTLWQNWYDRIGTKNYDEESQKWNESPIKIDQDENRQRFTDWVDERIALDDLYLGYKTTDDTYELIVTDAEWATVCVPFAFEIPQNLQVYTVNNVDDNGCTLQLTAMEQTEANKPYLVNGPAANYSLSGQLVVGSPSEAGYLTNGLLTGTLTDIFVPQHAYVLQSQVASGLGFYRVTSEDAMPLTAYHAYLSKTEASQSRLRLPEVTGLSHMASEDGSARVIYNAMGQRVSDFGQGINLLHTTDGKATIIYKK